jgi:hypothetical protein
MDLAACFNAQQTRIRRFLVIQHCLLYGHGSKVLRGILACPIFAQYKTVHLVRLNCRVEMHDAITQPPAIKCTGQRVDLILKLILLDQNGCTPGRSPEGGNNSVLGNRYQSDGKCKLMRTDPVSRYGLQFAIKTLPVA